jgi:hypothetical protein
VQFLSGWKLWRERTGALTKFGKKIVDFWWIFVVLGVGRT